MRLGRAPTFMESFILYAFLHLHATRRITYSPSASRIDGGRSPSLSMTSPFASGGGGKGGGPQVSSAVKGRSSSPSSPSPLLAHHSSFGGISSPTSGAQSWRRVKCLNVPPEERSGEFGNVCDDMQFFTNSPSLPFSLTHTQTTFLSSHCSFFPPAPTLNYMESFRCRASGSDHHIFRHKPST